VEHIEFFWYYSDLNLLLDFIRKSSVNSFVEPCRRKYHKKLNSELIIDILKKIPVKKAFYQRKLQLNEFEALNDLFISYNVSIMTIDLNDKGNIRYKKTNLSGMDFYFIFLIHSEVPKII